MFESSHFLRFMQVSFRGFLQIYKYMENLEFHFSFIFLREYYLYLSKCDHPVIECFCLSLLPGTKFSLKRPPSQIIVPSCSLGSTCHLRALTRWGHFYDSQGGSLVSQDFLDFLPLLWLTLQSSRTAGAWGSVVRNLWAKASRFCLGSGVQTWPLRAMFGVSFIMFLQRDHDDGDGSGDILVSEGRPGEWVQ